MFNFCGLKQYIPYSEDGEAQGFDRDSDKGFGPTIRKLIYIYICIHVLSDIMVRVISISDEVYFELSKLKNGRSFTEVIKSLVEKKGETGNFGEVMRFFGTINDSEARNMRKASKEFRRRFVSKGSR